MTPEMGTDRLHSLSTIHPDQVKSLRDVVIDAIKEAIVNGTLQPGQHLKERDLSTTLGISTTPIKEALRVLEQSGFVTTVPRKGAYVSDVINSSIAEIIMMRAHLDGLAARFATLKITPDQLKELGELLNRMRILAENESKEELVVSNTRFHTMIREVAGNQMLLQVLSNITSIDKAFRTRALQYQVEVKEGFQEHQKIYQAIREGNADLAESTMMRHILRTANNVLGHTGSTEVASGLHDA